MARLPIRVRQFEDEPAWSLLHRLARLAGTGSAREFCYDFELNYSRVAGASDLDRFCELGGFDLRQVAKASIRTTRHLVVNDERLPDNCLTNAEIRLCPRCLREDLQRDAGPVAYRPHWRDWWFVRDIVVCPFHGVELFRSETSNTRNRMAHTHLDPLDIGADDETAVDIETDEVSDVGAERYILSRMGFGETEPNVFLDHLPLDRAITCIKSLGAAVLGGLPGHFVDDPRSVLTKGYEVLQSRSSFECFLDECYGRFMASDSTGFSPVAVYGYLYAWLERERSPRASGTLLDDMRNTVFEHALRTFPVKRYTKVFGTKITERHLHTIEDIEHLTKVRGERLRGALVKLGYADAATAALDGWDLLFTPVEAASLCEALSRSRRGFEVRRDYSISTKRFIELQQTGKLVPWLKLGTPEEDACIWMELELQRKLKTP